MVWTAALAALLVAAGVTVRAYANSQWYVGVTESEVAIYNGIPRGLPMFDLSHVEELTGIPATEALRLPRWRELREGITTGSLQEARGIVADIRVDVERRA